jgi:hypothetical protein
MVCNGFTNGDKSSKPTTKNYQPKDMRQRFYDIGNKNIRCFIKTR